MIEVEVIVADERWSAALPDPEAMAAGAVKAALAVEPAASVPESAEVAVLLAADASVRELNRTWRGRDQATNVLSFPAPPGASPPGTAHLGDIALAYETTLREAEAEAKSLVDHAIHLIVHGTLHLLGRDHAEEGEAETMEALEIEALARLGIADPYYDRAG